MVQLHPVSSFAGNVNESPSQVTECLIFRSGYLCGAKRFELCSKCKFS